MNTMSVVKKIAATLITVGLMGCFSTESPTSTSNEPDTGSPDSILAGRTVGGALARLANLEQYSYGQEDVATVRVFDALFKELLKLSPDNKQYRFGVSITGVIVAFESRHIAEVLDKALQNRSPLDPGFILEIPRARAVVVDEVARLAGFPEFHQFQDALADSVLPALDSAIANMTVVAADTGFVMEIPEGSLKKTVGQTEALLLLGSFKALRGLLTLGLAYDIDIDNQGSYDFEQELREVGRIRQYTALSSAQKAALEHVRGLLSPQSTFLSVREGWESRLSIVGDDISGALPSLRSGLSSLSQRTHQGPNPLITSCAEGVSGNCIPQSAIQLAIEKMSATSTFLDDSHVIKLPEIGHSVKVNYRALLGGIKNFRSFVPHYGLEPASSLSAENPLVYFTTADGKKSGSIQDVMEIIRKGRADQITVSQAIFSLQSIVILPDPSFGGLFPELTTQQFWQIVEAASFYAGTASGWDVLESTVISLLSPIARLRLVGSLVK